MDSIFEMDTKWFEMETSKIRLDFCVDFLILWLIRSRYRHNYVRMHSFASEIWRPPGSYSLQEVFFYLIILVIMERTDWSITSSYGDGTREDFLFTYSEEEKQEHELNKNNAQLILNPKYILVSPAMIRAGYSYLEAILYWFIDFFLAHNERFYCTNEQLGVMLGVTEKTISLAINKLAKDGLIDVSYKIKSWWGKIRFIKNVTSNWTETLCPTLPKGNGIYNKIIDNKIIETRVSENSTSTSTSDAVIVPYHAPTRIIFSTDDLRDFADYIDDFRNYWEETDSKGTARWRKQKTWDTHRRLLTWKKNNDTNFWRNKPAFPLEDVKNASVQYYIWRNHPDKQKPYADFLAKHHVLDKWKDYASMVLGSWFKF